MPDPARTTGRYHCRGSVGAWYASGTQAAMWAEFDRHFTGDGVERSQVLRRAGSFVCEVEVLDLTHPIVLGTLSLSCAELVSDDYAIPQAVAEAARAAGFHALLAPSAAVPGTTTLVVFASGIVGVEEQDVTICTPPP